MRNPSFKMGRRFPLYFVIRMVSIIGWSALVLAYALSLFRHDRSTDWRILCSVVVAPIIGWIISYPHPRRTVYQTAQASALWSPIQLLVGVALFGVSVGVGKYLNRIGFNLDVLGKLPEILESVVWFMGLLIWNPCNIGLWIVAALNQLLLCSIAKQRYNRKLWT